MGDEAGQSLENIIIRKDLERELGNGLFVWGIGNSLGKTMWNFVSETKSPKVFFSKMKSKPKKIDKKPKMVYYWTHYLDRLGEYHKLPEHTLVLSRGYTNRTSKKTHFALICQRKEPIYKEKWEQINFYSLKNIYSKKNKLGFSQVTAIVERNLNSYQKSNFYEIIFTADLVEPYFVTLTNPVRVKSNNLKELNSLLSSNELKKEEWKNWLLDFKKNQETIKVIPNNYVQNNLPIKGIIKNSSQRGIYINEYTSGTTNKKVNST